MTAQQHSDLRELIRKEVAFRIVQRRRLDKHEMTKRMHDDMIRRSERRIFDFIEGTK